MLTTRRRPLTPNSTTPASRANSVSSLPRPTLAPGWWWVPRWRMRISPALTTWPPKRFTPRYCAFESRPFLEELAPFLCAMSGSPLLDSGDLDAGEVGAETLALLVPGLVIVLLDDDLRATQVFDDLRRHPDLGESLGVMRDGVDVDQQDRGQLNAEGMVGLYRVE